MQFQRRKSKRKSARKNKYKPVREPAIKSTGRDAVSIGWNCDSAVTGVSTGLRSRRCDGYKTCPFDLIISNYDGVVQCFEDDFKYFCDPGYLQLVQMPSTLKHFCTDGVGDMIIYNARYKFFFNHESPNDEYFVDESWVKGMGHFVMNNYEEFIKRFSRRIENMREMLRSGKHITFILTRPETGLEDISELVHVIKSTYPSLEFDFKFRDFDKQYYHDFLLFMKFNKEDREVKRLGL